MARKRNNILSAVMNSPVTLGGFTFSYGFVMSKLNASLGLRGANLCIAAATRHGHDRNAPDARWISDTQQERLWDAMGTGDMPTINEVYRLIQTDGRMAGVI